LAYAPIVSILLSFNAGDTLRNAKGELAFKKARNGSVGVSRLLKEARNGERRKLTVERFQVLTTAANGYPVVMDLLYGALRKKEAQVEENLGTVLVDLQGTRRPAFSASAVDNSVTTQLSFELPTSLSKPGVHRFLYDSAKEFYSILEGLSPWGFALGWDILPDDIPLVNPEAAKYFSGI
jgi:hypothetical protein